MTDPYRQLSLAIILHCWLACHSSVFGESQHGNCKWVRANSTWWWVHLSLQLPFHITKTPLHLWPPAHKRTFIQQIGVPTESETVNSVTDADKRSPGDSCSIPDAPHSQCNQQFLPICGVVLDRLLWHNKWQETHSDSIHQHHSKWPWDDMHHLSCTIPTAQANQRE
jgi:hypothetical protein